MVTEQSHHERDGSQTEETGFKMDFAAAFAGWCERGQLSDNPSGLSLNESVHALISPLLFLMSFQVLCDDDCPESSRCSSYHHGVLGGRRKYSSHFYNDIMPASHQRMSS